MSNHLHPDKRVGGALVIYRELGSLVRTRELPDCDWGGWKKHVPSFELVLRDVPKILQGHIVIRPDTLREANYRVIRFEILKKPNIGIA